MPDKAVHTGTTTLLSAGSLVNVLGVVYDHRKTRDGGDRYLTQFGLRYARLLEIRNWYQRSWFEKHRVKLEGTSAVYRLPTKMVNGEQIDLVVKNCRVGEDVPVATRTLLEFMHAEFNSPWEEFSLVMEMREGTFGPSDIRIDTQLPLAIYVPPEKMQMWQSGRSRHKINRIKLRHPGIELDILRQYKLVYAWIKGHDIIELLQKIGVDEQTLAAECDSLTRKAIDDMVKKGFAVADMKPAHVVIGDEQAEAVMAATEDTEEGTRRRRVARLGRLVKEGKYSVVDYELLLRTPEYEAEVKASRRHSYLDDQRDRFIATELPQHLHATEIMEVPYIWGHAESTGGQLWVVGKNARLFDYFLPERWRTTPSWKLSTSNEVYYTISKDNIHIVWKTSRVGERPAEDEDEMRAEQIRSIGFNSPFEEFAFSHHLRNNGVPTVYVRAIYRTGSAKLERSPDAGRYRSHRHLRDPEEKRILTPAHNYIMIRGYYNGSDEWIAGHEAEHYRPMSLLRAMTKGEITHDEFRLSFDVLQGKLRNAGYDGALLTGNDLIVASTPDGALVRDERGVPEARICNFELIRKV